MSHLKDREIAPQRAKFAENVGKHLMTQTEAARKAGYAHSNSQITRLMEDPLVLARIIDYLRNQAVKWQVLAAKAKGVLLEGLEATILKDGEKVSDMATRLESTRIVMGALRKGKGNLLEDAAAEEDTAAESNLELAKKFLGPPPETTH